MPVFPVSQDGSPTRMEAGLRRRGAPARGPGELPWLRMAVVSAVSVIALAAASVLVLPALLAGRRP